MTATLKGISSMATRQLLGELAQAWTQATGHRATIESVGGVDAAKRVAAGEAFDVVLLATDAVDKLAAGGSVVAGSRVDIVDSGVAIAVKEGAAIPDVGDREALQRAVLAAPSVGYSTGPSGVALLKLFEAWGIAPQLQGRLVQAPPGVPVGSLVARGDVALGFQQRSELIHLPGLTVLPMPADVQILTTFCGGVCAASTQPALARDFLAFLASPATADAKRRNGMDPAAA